MMKNIKMMKLEVFMSYKFLCSFHDCFLILFDIIDLFNFEDDTLFDIIDWK